MFALLVARRITFVFSFWAFCPKMLAGGGDLQMLLRHSMNGPVVEIP